MSWILFNYGLFRQEKSYSFLNLILLKVKEQTLQFEFYQLSLGVVYLGINK